MDSCLLYPIGALAIYVWCILWPFPARLSPGGGSAPAPAAASSEGTCSEWKHEQGFAGERGPLEETVGGWITSPFWTFDFATSKRQWTISRAARQSCSQARPYGWGVKPRGLSVCVPQRKGCLQAWKPKTQLGCYHLLLRCRWHFLLEVVVQGTLHWREVVYLFAAGRPWRTAVAGKPVYSVSRSSEPKSVATGTSAPGVLFMEENRMWGRCERTDLHVLPPVFVPPFSLLENLICAGLCKVIANVC